MRGFLLVDKDKALTSFDVVRQIRRISGVKRVGHSGTLDPMATGLLLVAVGEATKLLEYYIGCDKVYEAKARFGFVSDTFDAEGKIVEVKGEGFAKVGKADLQKLIEENFLGEIEQVPPKYSALKINGKKAYELARKGEEVDLKARKVKVYDFEIVEFAWPDVSFRISCGSGTYIRSLVHDLGNLLGNGAYLTALRRTHIDNFSLEGSCKLEELDKNFEQCLIFLEKMPWNGGIYELDEAEYGDLSQGKAVLNKKSVHKFPVLAYLNDKVVGVLEESKEKGKIKFKKMIF